MEAQKSSEAVDGGEGFFCGATDASADAMAAGSTQEPSPSRLLASISGASMTDAFPALPKTFVVSNEPAAEEPEVAPASMSRPVSSASPVEHAEEKVGEEQKGVLRSQEEQKKMVAGEMIEKSVYDSLREKRACIICFGGFPAKRPATTIPCAKQCNSAPVHEKCIYEWKETRKSSNGGSSSCPLCRGALLEMNYTPPDPLDSASLGDDFRLRKSFVSRPIPQNAGVVRCYVRAIRDDSALFGKSIRYEFFLQAPHKMRYPHGPLPSQDSPAERDILLMVARKRGITRGACFNSIVDITMDRQGQNFDRKSHDFVGCVKSSFSGLEHTILAPYNLKMPVLVPSAGGDHGASPTDDEGSIDVGTDHVISGSSTSGNSAVNGKKKRTLTYLELGSVRYTQNRIGRSVGPRRMQACVPRVHADDETGTSGNSSSKEDDNEDEEDERKWCTQVYRPAKSAETMRHLLRKGPAVIKGMDCLLYGYNKQPYWLDSIQAFSLDFHGRVTLPSNKNFQLVLEGAAAPGYVLPSLNNPSDVVLQFGKVHEGPIEVYTLDVQWPLSPLQAFGICITASIQKVCCA